MQLNHSQRAGDGRGCGLYLSEICGPTSKQKCRASDFQRNTRNCFKTFLSFPDAAKWNRLLQSGEKHSSWIGWRISFPFEVWPPTLSTKSWKLHIPGKLCTHQLPLVLCSVGLWRHKPPICLDLWTKTLANNHFLLLACKKMKTGIKGILWLTV